MVVIDLTGSLYRFVNVSFNEGVKHFIYLCEDWVLVPIGSGNIEKEAFVEKISYILADEVQKLYLVTVRHDVKVV